jgi:hypothetical protein
VLAVSEDEIQRAYELVRVKGLSYSAAGKQLGGIPKSTIRAAVTREAVRRATTAPTATPVQSDRADAGFLSALLGEPAAVADASVERLNELATGVTPPADRLHLDAGDDEPDLGVVDIETLLVSQIRRIELAIKTATEGEAQKYARTAAQLASELRKYQREKRNDDGLLSYTLADADAAIQRLDDRAHAVADQHLVCAECGRRMRRKGAENE